VTRRFVLLLVIVAVLLVGGFVVVAGLDRLDRRKSSPVQTALRQRVSLLENDQFVLALMATPHTTRSTEESLTCLPPGSSTHAWNFREIASGGLDTDRIDAVIDQAAAFGWQPVTGGTDSDGAYTKTIEPGVAITLAATTVSDQLELSANASTGLSCPA
jgi:hypothetical protein